MNYSYGLFLTLSPNDNSILLPIITNLQKKYSDQPPFNPHITIYHATTVTSLAATISAVESATRNVRPFTIESDGYGFEEVWSKILYLKIKPSKKIIQIESNIMHELGDTTTKEYVPHISLMYKDALSPKERNKIIASLSLPPTFTIQGIQVLSPGANNNDWRDYTKWQVMHTIDFSQQYNPPNTNHISTSINRHQL